MSGNSLRDQLSGLMLERQKARDKTQLLNKEGKEKVVKTQSAAVSKNTPTGQKNVEKKNALQPVRPRLTPMPGLPVSLRAKEIIEAIKKNRVLILCGETGSGKTTQLPKL